MVILGVDVLTLDKSSDKLAHAVVSIAYGISQSVCFMLVSRYAWVLHNVEACHYLFHQNPHSILGIIDVI